ncbi:MAG: InlB B-repeat-containing protein, partial [Eubacteriales bacterium]|nr:InlB B-repeat-containing protein [Eubacteriales bacterium]
HTPGEEWLFDDVNHWQNCTGCEEKLNKDAHTFGNWSVTVQPEVGVAGEKERECSVCGYKETAPVEALKEQITVSVEGGSVNGGASVTVDKDGTVTVVANPAPEGKTFKGWSTDGGQTIISEDASYSFNATENVTLTAIYDDIVPGGEQPEKTGLSGGAIAGIAIGAVAVVGLGGFSVFWFAIRKKKFSDLVAIFKKK